MGLSTPALTSTEAAAAEQQRLGLSDAAHTTAVCLSGGGIRSGSFQLGLLHALDKAGQLDRFHWLSCVSGGGYAAGLVSAWRLHRRRANQPSAMHGPDFDATVDHLRRHSAYLTPQGAMSASAWSLWITLARNMVFSCLMLLPGLAGLTLVPLAIGELHVHWHRWVGVEVLRVAMWIAIGQFGWSLADPFSKSAKTGLSASKMAVAGYFVVAILSPLVLPPQLLIGAMRQAANENSEVWHNIMVLAMPVVGLFAAALVQRMGAVRRRMGARNLQDWGTIFSLFLAIAAGEAVAVLACLWLAANPTWQNLQIIAPRVVAWLSPVVLGALIIIASATFTMVYGRFNDVRGGEREDRGFEAREWTSFWQGHVARMTILWSLLTTVVLIGPALLYATTQAWTSAGEGEERSILHALESLLSLVAAGAAGRFLSGDTPDGDAAPTKRRLNPKLVGNLGAVLLLGVAVSWCAEEVQRIVVYPQALPELEGLNWGDRWMALFAARVTWVNHLSFDATWLTCLVLFLVSYGAGEAFSINRISLQSVYRNRLTQAFLGAARAWIPAPVTGRALGRHRQREPDALTGFDPGDNFDLDELTQVRPLPLYNMALHMTEGATVAGRVRTVHPFTVSPLLAGSANLGPWNSKGQQQGAYRPTDAYSGPGGVSLAAAMAVSGAAANPNFGSHSSPLVRMLMNLVNMRLGVWWGNPAHNSSWRRTNPNNAAVALLQEAVRLPGPEAAAIHLADGGHFENLGLYEMVRRRAQLVLVSDASADPRGRCDSLAQAVRLCEIDFGVRIRLLQVPGEAAASGELPLARVAEGGIMVGEISYPALVQADGSEVPATVAKLIYVKPRLQGDEPLVVQQYARLSPAFPHESTADQWFTEGQFEAYRQLGQHLGAQVAAALAIDTAA